MTRRALVLLAASLAVGWAPAAGAAGTLSIASGGRILFVDTSTTANDIFLDDGVPDLFGTKLEVFSLDGSPITLDASAVAGGCAHFPGSTTSVTCPKVR